LNLVNNEHLYLINIIIKARDNVIKAQYLAENDLKNYKQLLKAFDPQSILKRGYAILSTSGKIIKSAKSIKQDQQLDITIYDAKLGVTINKIELTKGV
ncbi:MAG: exodeoxyribonuclease VII large subunit, partial [Candidatus Saccharibacteria bacterium]